MGEVINLEKRRSWRALKKAVAERRVYLPATTAWPCAAPTTDLGLAFAYALHALRGADGQHAPPK